MKAKIVDHFCRKRFRSIIQQDGRHIINKVFIVADRIVTDMQARTCGGGNPRRGEEPPVVDKAIGISPQVYIVVDIAVAAAIQ